MSYVKRSGRWRIVYLDPFDVSSALMLAARQRAARQATGDRETKLQASRGGFDLHFSGALGEVAVCACLGIDFDRSVLRGSDGGIDITYRGMPGQIKAFTFNGPDFAVMVTPGKLTADLLFPTQIKTPATITAFGWMAREEFLSKAKLRNLGYGAGLALEPDHFHDFDELDAHIDARSPGRACA